MFALGLFLLMFTAAARADDIRVRIAWGGGSERLWQGTISASDGTLMEPRLLGVEADEPGSMWIDEDPDGGQRLVIQQRSPRAYDGVDVLVRAPLNSKLRVHFSAADGTKADTTIESPLKDLTSEFINKELDDRGNRLLLMRTPGDLLRVALARDSLVFASGETFRGTLEPRALPLADSARARIKVQLSNNGGKELWSQQYDVQSGREVKIPLEIPLPMEEGVYDVLIAAVQNPNWSQAMRQPLNWKRTIAERQIQLMVIGARGPSDPGGEREFTQLVEVDPANPHWYEKFNKLPQLQLAKARLPRLWKGPLGNGCLQSRSHLLGDLAELSRNTESPDVAWEAYWLPITHPGRPHVVEVDYPSDVPQTLGISIVEPNAAGSMTAIAPASGVDRVVDLVASSAGPRWLRHRLIFWPRTTTPLLLMTNEREQSPAVYGKIRVLEGGRHLSRMLPEREPAQGRLLAAYLDRPLIPENFSAEECLDPWSRRSLDDWWTFYEGGTRLVEYLHHRGYNGLMLGVLADGSTIYPSGLVSPTPRYDTGIFFATAQDPVRKDVLEMLLRLFDRENLQLIPSVEFAAPLPELEAIRRAGGAAAEGIEWIGAQGTSWCVSSPPQRGLAPYYNLLHPRVQAAMLGVLRELAERYASHPSFSGLSIRLAADGYAQLPGPDWGLDDATITRFERETKMRVPGSGSQRFAARSAYLAREPYRRVWLEWRAGQLSKFYRRAHEELAAIRPGSRLYLTGAGMIAGTEMEAELRPSLPRRTTVAGALLRAGIDGRAYQDSAQQIVLLRPERVLPQANLAALAADLETSQTAEFDRYFQNVGTMGSLFFHAPREVHVESFDRKSPFKSSYLGLISQASPSEEQNRRRFIHSLAALDSQVMIDGGWLLSMGQESALRDLVTAYRALPAIRFQAIGNRQTADVQPITFRSGVHEGRTYLYVVNDAPFATTARIHVEAGAACRVEELSGTRKIAPLRPDAESGLYWEAQLEPYDLLAVRLSESNVQFSNPQVSWPAAVETVLRTQIRRLGARAAALRNPPPLEIVSNASFEQAAGAEASIPDWAVTVREGVSINLDTTEKHDGRQSVKMSSRGGVACLVSRVCPIPRTGRLSMAVWLRAAESEKQPSLRLALEGKLLGRDYYRFAPLGAAAGLGRPSVAIGSQWGQYVFQVDDLPLEGLSSVRLRFDLMGEGEVWVDDVQLFSLAFTKPELVELSKMITLAEVRLHNGQIGDCLRLVDGYWPRFLDENVPLPADAVSLEASDTGSRPSDEPQPERSGWLNRVKDLVPESLRF
jgi:hypothetical protein